MGGSGICRDHQGRLAGPEEDYRAPRCLVQNCHQIRDTDSISISLTVSGCFDTTALDQLLAAGYIWVSAETLLGPYDFRTAHTKLSSLA